MSISPPEGAVQTSIVDNRDGNTLFQAIRDIAGGGRELCIATAFFSLDALNLIGEHLHEFESVRLLFGGDGIPALVQRILGLKAADPAADVTQLEADIDAIVERLYFGEAAE